MTQNPREVDGIRSLVATCQQKPAPLDVQSPTCKALGAGDFSESDCRISDALRNTSLFATLGLTQPERRLYGS